MLTTASLKWGLGAWSIQGLPLLAASTLVEVMPPWLTQQRNPAMSPHTKRKEQEPVTLKTTVEKNQQSLGGGGGGGENGWQNLAWRKTECAKESHDWCNQLLGMCMPLKTADLMISKVHVSNICSDLLFIYIYLFIVCFFMFNSHCWRKQD